MRSTILLGLFLSLPALAGGIEEMLTVKQVQGQQATLEGKVGSLKAGDKVYFARSPFEFSVASVSGTQATINLPANSDVGVGNTMVLKPTDAMKKAMDTESRLKKALEE